MTADFMDDAEYVGLCGSRTVLEVVSKLDGIFDRHKLWSYEAKTAGRIVDLATVKKEITCLQPVLEESRKLSDYFWKTALYLQERELAAQKHMEWLRKQEKEQERLRVAFKAFVRGPAFPQEIIYAVLNRFLTNNKLIWEGGPDRTNAFVYGLLPLAVYRPCLLLPHYGQAFSTEWTLMSIANQEMKWTILEDPDVLLTNHIKLRVDASGNDILTLRPLMRYSHQWKRLDICVSRFNADDFVNTLKPCLSLLEELRVDADYMSSSGVIVPPESFPRLKTALLYFPSSLEIFNSGILNSVSRLTLDYIDANRFRNHRVFRKKLKNLPLALSRLSLLRELIICDTHCNGNDLEDLQKVNSSSLRSLDLSDCSNNAAIAFLKLFVDCPVDYIDVHADVLQEVEKLFGEVRYLCIECHVPGILSERKQDGSLAFPKMEQLSLYNVGDLSENDTLQVQNRLLEIVRMRYEDPTARRVGHLRVPKKVVPNEEVREELERYIPSLVLF